MKIPILVLISMTAIAIGIIAALSIPYIVTKRDGTIVTPPVIEEYNPSTKTDSL